MFWIPLCLIAVVIYGISSVSRSIGEEKVEKARRSRDAVSEAFTDSVFAPQLEQELRKRYKGQYDDCFRRICDFVGEKPASDDKHPLIQHWEDWAVASEMCSRGKLPSCMALYGAGQLTPTPANQSELIFAEKFMLKLESELQKAGVRTFLLYETDNPCLEQSHCVYRDFIDRYGYGHSNFGGSRLRWVNSSVYSLEYFS